MFYPSDVCFFTLRTECGSPGFIPKGNALDNVQIFTIEFEDAEIDADIVEVSEGGGAFVRIPKKSEAFKGRAASKES